MKYSSLFWLIAIGYFSIEWLMLYLAVFYPGYLVQHEICSKQGCDSWLADGLFLVAAMLQLPAGVIPFMSAVVSYFILLFIGIDMPFAAFPWLILTLFNAHFVAQRFISAKRGQG